MLPCVAYLGSITSSFIELLSCASPQVETFEMGDTIYREGDTANSLYIVKQGQVTISSTEEGRLERVMNNGDAFGAGSLEPVPRRRVATAVATSFDVICLRLIRADWLQFSDVVDETAEEGLPHRGLDPDRAGADSVVG
jgi:CRP-like cAMP-binding protein